MSITLERVQHAIDFMEAHLFADLPLAAVAERAACSPWHFHRLFVALTGETPAGYVWKRRLAEICRRLVETAQPLVDVALDCGFESQATFTRAFTRHVGVSPGRFRRQQAHNAPAYLYPPLDVQTLAERQQKMDEMDARIARLPAFDVIGLSGRFKPTSPHIPELWARFAPRIHEVPHRRGQHTLGICIDTDPATIEEVGFTYVACVEVDATNGIPAGMTKWTVPANTYAVVTHRGHISRLPDTVKHIFGRWLPTSGHRHVSAPDFEYYDPNRWNPATGDGEVDLWIPIAAEGGDAAP